MINKNIFWNSYYVTRTAREVLHKHHSMLLWFTGLSGSGKSLLANLVEKKLYDLLVSTYILDGDNTRYALCHDLDFSHSDRVENMRRIGEVSKLMVDAGLVVLATYVSPYCVDRQMIRDLFPKDSFFEIFVDTPLCICEQRDVKGLYKKARSGLISNFTGITDSYEIPQNPEIYLDGQKSILDLVSQILTVVVPKIFHI